MPVVIDDPIWGRLVHGDCLAVLKDIPDSSVDSVVTDPPAGIAFMGKDWDDPNAWQYPVTSYGFTDGGQRVDAPAITSGRNPTCRKCKRHKRGWKDTPGCSCSEPDFDTGDALRKARDTFVVWLTSVMRECLRVLKPGGHAVVWSIPKTSHWTAWAIEDAGFEIRDCVYHLKDRSSEVQAFLASLSPAQAELLLRAEPTDQLMLHIFGQGFPKSLNVGKAIDKMAGAEREVVGSQTYRGKGAQDWRDKDGHNYSSGGASAAGLSKVVDITTPATPEAAQWEGWGTALKPSVETWWLCRKPIATSSIAAQVLATGTGAINIDGCRIEHVTVAGGNHADNPHLRNQIRVGSKSEENLLFPRKDGERLTATNVLGRWPSHLVLSHAPGCKQVGTKQVQGNRTDTRPEGDAGREDKTQWRIRPTEATRRGYSNEDGNETVAAWECVEGCPVKELDEQSGERKTTYILPQHQNNRGTEMLGAMGHPGVQGYDDTGGASRFFQQFIYCPKASASEKNDGLDDLPAEAQHKLEEQAISTQSNRRCLKCGMVKFGQPHCECAEPEWAETEGSKVKNSHPTVKPITLMRYLCRMVTPPGGTILDPFAGSGSTLVAAVEEGFKFLGIEREDEYIAIAKVRVQNVIDDETARKDQLDFWDLMQSLPQEGD